MSVAKQLRLVDYLTHIVEAADRCQRYVEDMDEVAFLQDEKTQDAVIRTLEVIGEASNNINKRYPDFSDEHQEVPFRIAYEMRNALSHGYFQVDLNIVWKTIHTDIPWLQQAIEDLLESMGTHG